MKSRGVRVSLVVLAIAALAAAGAVVWRIEQRIAAARSAAETFESDARFAVMALSEWRAAEQAYVAEGQPAEAWMAKAAGIDDIIGPKLAALHKAATTAEAQGTLESAVETFSSLVQSDARAREYVKSGQRLSASDVIFAEAAPILDRVIVGIDTARSREHVASAEAIEGLRRWELIALAAAALVMLAIVLMLLPAPESGDRAPDAFTEPETAAVPHATGKAAPAHDLSDGVVRRARPLPDDDAPSKPAAVPADAAPAPALLPPVPDLDAVADLCASLARVQDTRELQGLLERTSKALNASGVIVWMPEGPQGTLRPVLSQGYAPLALSRMGIIHPAADNATATAFRTKSAVVVPAEGPASGAVVAPLINADGCSGVMAVELREGVVATPQVRAVATIVAAQLATMLTPGSAAAGQGATAPAAAGR